MECGSVAKTVLKTAVFGPGKEIQQTLRSLPDCSGTSRHWGTKQSRTTVLETVAVEKFESSLGSQNSFVLSKLQSLVEHSAMARVREHEKQGRRSASC